MAGNVYKWSLTPGSNQSSDPDINWIEGQLPGTVNDSARAMMAGVAGWLQDTNATLTTGGSSNAYTVTSNTPYAALATGIKLVLKASFSNTGSATLNVTPSGGAAFGAKAIKVINPAGGESDPTVNQIRINGHYIFEYDAAANAAAGAWILLNPSTPLLSRGYIDGVQMSNNGGTPNSKVDVSAGACRDDTNAFDIVTSSGTIDCSTTGANGLDAGSLGVSTWYHAFVIAKPDGTTALLASTSVSSPTMPAGYSYKRRIGSFLTDGASHILAFSQTGEQFLWNAVVLDINANNPGTSAVNRVLRVPTGVKVLALFNGGVNNFGVASGTAAYFSSLDVSDQAPSFSTTPLYQTGAGAANVAAAASSTCTFNIVRTDTSAQVRSRLIYSDANVSLIMATIGWVDQRGKNS